uniref:AN1-type domain-containing protein n=1 Tax=candidate division WWE3 bacterium TaxID=2053526 RepID=A0A7C4XTE0_UNCKA
MPNCEQCGKEVILPFESKFCRCHFCLEHRLLD